MLFRTANTRIKNKKISSLQAIEEMFHPNKHFPAGGKVSDDTSLKGSLTVESAFVLSLFFLCICTIISFMDIYRLQSEYLNKACEQAKEAGMYAYIAENNGDVTIPHVYTYESPVSVIPLPKIVMFTRVKVHPWTGYLRDGSSGEENVEEMVYVSDTGGVYHTSASCTYLSLSTRQVAGSHVSSLRNNNGEKYYPCESCSRKSQPGNTVYVTSQGNRYHNQASCSRLKRNARLVKKSQVKQMNICSRCAGRGD